MKIMKKGLSIFLAALFVLSSMSVSLVAFAADEATEAQYRILAYSFFKYTASTSGATTTYTVNTDSFGNPVMSIVGDMDQYDVKNESGSYVYADDNASPVRAISYDHVVTAKDNSTNAIRNAAIAYLGIADTVMSYKYGIGNYTIPMVTDAVSKKLMTVKGDNGEYIFLDGYTYLLDVYGEIAGRSVDKTYSVVNGEPKYFASNSDNVIWKCTDGSIGTMEQVMANRRAAYQEVTLFEACNVDTVLEYFSGNCTGINSGNWFHNFIFRCSTDINTVLTTETLVGRNLTIRNLEVTWKLGRSYDESGTKAQYFNKGYTADKDVTSVDTTRVKLAELNAAMSTYFSTYYSGDTLENARNNTLISSYYPNITSNIAVFKSISNEAKLAVFGNDAYSYMNLVTQLTPMVGTYNIAQYLPVHTYDKYNTEYKITDDRLTTIVSTIDGLLSSQKVGKIVKTFIDFSDPKYSDKAFYGIEADTPKEILYQLIQNLVFDDKIINLVIGFLYPMVTDLLDKNLTDSLINGILDGVAPIVTSLVKWVTESNDGWLALIYGVLLGENIGLTPAGVAYSWQQCGYNTQYPAIYQKLLNAQGGTLKQTAQTKDFGVYAIGKEGDRYHLNRWGNFDAESCVWNIKGDRAKFQKALCAVLAPIAPLLAILLGNQSRAIFVGDAIVDLYLVLRNLDVYNDVLVPLLETLGIPNLCTPAQFRSYSSALNGTYNVTNVENLINRGILNPILDWVVNNVLEDPIQIVLGLLPNLSHYLTSGALISSIKNLEVPIGLRVRSNLGFNYYDGTVHTLVIKDLLKDALDFLDSLQGVLTLVGFSVDTGVPVVGYYADGSTQVYRPGMAGYNADNMKNQATTAYMSDTGNMSLNRDDEYHIEVTGLDENGNYTDYIMFNDVGWRNSAGYVVTERNDSTATPEEYNTPVQAYYEYSRYDEEAQKDVTIRTTFLPTEYEQSGEYKLVRSIITIKAKAELPSIMDYKLQACGVEKTLSSVRDSAFSMTDRLGNNDSWEAGSRKGIEMKINNKKTEGLVLIFLLRYLLSALKYRGYEDGHFVGEYSILDAFGLTDTLEKDLFNGLKLMDIINNIALDPDAAIAAIVELFQKNEFGSIYEVVGGVMRAGQPYTYGLDYVDYHNEMLDYAEAHNDYTYGNAMLYSEYWTKADSDYIINNIDNIVDDVLAMLKLKDIESLSSLLEGLLGKYLFSNKMLSTIAGFLYGMIDSLGGSIDLTTILDAALDVDYSKKALANAITYQFGQNTDMSTKLTSEFNKGNKAYTQDTFYKMVMDEESGELVRAVDEEGNEIPIDWGYNNEAIKAQFTDTQIFLKGISSILSPFAILFKFLMCGEDLSILGLINIPGYEGYQFAWISLLEALSADADLASYEEYFRHVYLGPSAAAQNSDAVYYLLAPIFKFVENLIASPVEVLLGLIPNLMFVISVGGVNGILNNLVHFVYVLLDIISPIYDAYPLVNTLLSNLRVGDIALNLAIPLDFDFNQLINSLIDSLLGSALSFDIENKNIILDTQEVEKELQRPVLDENGEPVLDNEGNEVVETYLGMVTENVYAVGTLNIMLPYIDFATLCAGTIQNYTSITGQQIVYLNASGGSDLLTLVLRLVMDTLFYKENAINIANFLIGFCQLDDEDDNDELLMEIFTYLNDEAHKAAIPDKILKIIATIFRYLVPLADNLGARFKKVDFSVTDMFGDLGNITEYIKQLADAGDSDSNLGQTVSGFAKLIAKIKAFFEAIANFFRSLFAK